MYKVVKRDGTVTSFDIHKITAALSKAFDACEKPYNDDVIEMMALRVTADFTPKIKNERIEVEEIQDSAERVLSAAGYADVAKAYILYRKQRENIRNIQYTTLDYQRVVDDYLSTADDNPKDDAALPYSLGGLILSNSGAITANYWLSEVYDEEIASAYRNCDIHIHDLNMLTGYCAGWSLRDFLMQGLCGVEGKVSRRPAKHLSTLCAQMADFLGIMQNEWAGAQGFSSFDTYLSAFVKTDHLSYKEVKQCLQSFVYGVNTASRWGSQSPFITITMDWTVPQDMAEEYAVVGGKSQEFQYKDCQAEMDMINRAFIEVMTEGDGEGKSFQFPIPTYALTKEFDWSDSENNRMLFEMAAKYGIPYFANYIHGGLEPGDTRRIVKGNFDLEKLYKRAGGFFGSGESTGSIGAVTINLPRIAYLSEDEKDFYRRLDKTADISARSLKTKRTVLNKLLASGLYPYTKKYLGSYDRHFSTIGVVGMNEACLNAKWIQADLSAEKSQKFAEDVLMHLREKLTGYQREYGDLYNLEAAPAESTAYRFARSDKSEYPDIITANASGVPYYTNSTNLPVGFTDDIFAALEIENHLQPLYTAGSVFHVYLGERLSSWREAMLIIRKITEHYQIPYYSLSPTYSICPEHGYLSGEVKTCPYCEKKTDVYSRITGYYRSMKNWNEGKLQEFKDRQNYAVGESI